MPPPSELRQIRRELETLTEMVRSLIDANDLPLTVEEAARIAGITVATMREKIAASNGEAPELTSYKRGRRRFIKRSDLHAWLTEHKKTSASELLAA